MADPRKSKMEFPQHTRRRLKPYVPVVGKPLKMGQVVHKQFRRLILSVCAVIILLGATPIIALHAIEQGEQPKVVYQEELLDQLSELIQNENCHHPCWWGWTLGEDNLASSQEKALAYFGEPLGGEDNTTHIRRGKSLRLNPTDADATLRMSLFFDTNNEGLLAFAMSMSFPELSLVDLSSYYLQSILEEYGIPDEINIYLVNQPTYSLVLKYHELGIYWEIDHTFPEERLYYDYLGQTDPITICSYDRTSGFNLWAEVSGLQLNPELIQSPWIGPRLNDLQGEYSLQQVTGLVPAEFTQIMLQPSGCITTLPLNQWGDPLQQEGILAGSVWQDANGDGLQTGEESNGFADVTVKLLDASQTQIDTTITNSNGNYSFAVDSDTPYIIEIVPPQDFAFTTANVGNDDTIDSDVDLVTGRTPSITVAAGQTDDTWDAGLVSGISYDFSPADVAQLITDINTANGTPGFFLFTTPKEFNKIKRMIQQLEEQIHTDFGLDRKKKPAESS